jgi:competence protein ComEA
MGSVAPDWRVIGAAPETDTSTSVPGRPRQVVSTRQIAWATATVIALLVVGAMAALLLMPVPGGVVVDAAGADGSWISRSAPEGPEGLDLQVGRAGVTSHASLVVDVEGAVARPGLVSVPAGGRVGDAIELAGGFGPNADLAAAASALNLAQEVTDGLKVVVPAIGEVFGSSGDTASSRDASGGLIDLNRATEAQLDSLPGVGPATVAKIVAAREETPFGVIDELRSRDIVGEATFGKLRDLVTVGR